MTRFWFIIACIGVLVFLFGITASYFGILPSGCTAKVLIGGLATIFIFGVLAIISSVMKW